MILCILKYCDFWCCMVLMWLARTNKNYVWINNGVINIWFHLTYRKVHRWFTVRSLNATPLLRLSLIHLFCFFLFPHPTFSPSIPLVSRLFLSPFLFFLSVCSDSQQIPRPPTGSSHSALDSVKSKIARLFWTRWSSKNTPPPSHTVNSISRWISG